ncbi:hypothetical protein D1816_12590 [Aquimarina sp. AD10]|uniref:DUF6089 domain-containing protein n=1 Tax=Aquimarina aggregata TaxID=1642818 RepID=A0A162YNE7_9FLAO|nr:MULTISPECIES: DUF6089 family protein [Aquimarina]AXT61148.1 hypothetical protein D1816_12590 [Aquimarina sp. AD10]KZS39243.1 hypothetical protein AWE51_11880 [Aquimarina aggregata]RKN02236.1 hypothetical protein D7033_02020 [Aquimarina sp. AD10]
MRYLTSFIFVLFFIQTMTSQTYEVGLMVGGANYIGDVGSTYYIAPSDIAFGAIGKWNRSKRHAFRASFLYAKISGDDSKGDDRRKQRGLSFDNSVKELSVGMEFNFWDWFLYDGQPQITPYLYTGITAFNYNSLALDTNNQINAVSDKWSFAIPMVLGIKKTLGRDLVIGAEIGARYTFTDNLDGSDPSDSRFGDGFGNLNNNDWYMFTGFTLSYTWGRIPCYCSF